MTNEEIELMRETVAVPHKNRHNPIWIKAFSEYNSDNEKKLGMGCMPCYGKVLQYHLIKNSNIDKS